MKIGIAGLGGMASVHYDNYRHIDGADVVAVVGKTERDKARASEWDVASYDDIPTMIEKARVEVVDVCTPTFLHKRHVMESLSHGCHTIVEKPIALSKKDAQEMYALANEKQRFLFVAQVLQFSKEVELLHRIVQSGEYGKALDASFERLSACPKWSQESWLFEREKSGLIPYDLHIHDLDVIISLFGPPDNVSYTYCQGAGKTYPEQYRFFYTCGGLNVVAEAAWFNADIPFVSRWRIYFEKAVVNYDGQKVTAYRLNEPPYEFDTKDSNAIPTGINLPPTGMFLSELTHFIACIAKGEPSDRVPEKQVLSVIEVLEKIH